jgi:hypothetical protein
VLKAHRYEQPEEARFARRRSAPAAAMAPQERLLALQRSAGNAAVAGMVQRMLRKDPSSPGAFDDEEAMEGAKVELETLVADVLKAEPKLKAKEATVRSILSSYAEDDPPDLAFDTVESVVEWLQNRDEIAGEEEDEEELEEEQEEEEEEEEEAEEEELEEEQEEEQQRGRHERTMRVGALQTTADNFHRTVKPLIMKAIPLEVLRKKVGGGGGKRGKGQTNFNFHVGRDGTITVSDNSARTSKGKDTGYAYIDGKVVKKKDES